MNLRDLSAVSYGGLFCLPILAIGAMLIIDVLGGMALLVQWLIGVLP